MCHFGRDIITLGCPLFAISNPSNNLGIGQTPPPFFWQCQDWGSASEVCKGISVSHQHHFSSVLWSATTLNRKPPVALSGLGHSCFPSLCHHNRQETSGRAEDPRAKRPVEPETVQNFSTKSNFVRFYFGTGCVVGAHWGEENCEQSLESIRMRARPPTLTIFGGFGASKNLFFKENLRGRAQAEGALCAKQAWPDVERWRCSRHLHRGSGTIHSLILGTASAPGAFYPPKTCQQWATGWCTRGAPSGQMLEDKLVLQRPEIIPVILFVRLSDTHIHPFHVEFWPEESDPIVLSSSCIKCWFYCQIFSGVVPNDVHAGVCLWPNPKWKKVLKSFLTPSFIDPHFPFMRGPKISF